jgi:hypothetical protein
MQEEKFRIHMKERKIEQSIIDRDVKSLKDFELFLQNELNVSKIDTSFLKDTRTYLKRMKLKDKEKLIFLKALKNYGIAIKRDRLVGNSNRLQGLGHWLMRLSDTLDEYVDEDLRTKILEAGGSIKYSSSANKKAAWTKCMMECLEKNVDEKTCKKILTNNLHYKNPKTPSIMKLRKMYRKSNNIDEVLEFLHDKWKTHVGEKFGYNSPEFKYVANDSTIETGKREGNIIYVSKIPFKLKDYLNAKDDKEKRYNYCHCGWVRASILKSNEKEISHNFCYCSGGWHKIPFETIFGQSLKVNIVKTVLKGDDMCTFAIHIPEEIDLDAKEK